MRLYFLIEFALFFDPLKNDEHSKNPLNCPSNKLSPFYKTSRNIAIVKKLLELNKIPEASPSKYAFLCIPIFNLPAMKKSGFLVLLSMLFLSSAIGQQATYTDVPFWQDWSESSFLEDGYNIRLTHIASDRNGTIQLLSTTGLMQAYQGKLVADRMYLPLADMQFIDMLRYRDQFVYLTDEAVLSNAWAGKVYLPYDLPKAKAFAGGTAFDFLIASDMGLEYVKEGDPTWTVSFDSSIKLQEIAFDTHTGGFWGLSTNSLLYINPAKKSIEVLHSGKQFTCLEVLSNGKELIIGTTEGYQVWDKSTQRISSQHTALPWPELTDISEINGALWFGSTWGAFRQLPEGGYAYYASRRWLPDDQVIEVAEGPENSVLVLTSGGMAQIHFEEMTLEQKAMHYEKQVRKRHIRLGFNSDGLRLTEPGNLSTGSYHDSDNDGLWTSMYLGSQLFRYAVTKSDEALQYAMESFEAMERLHTINGIQGFPARSFVRKGYSQHDKKAWNNLDEQWDWKGTTSSDEAIGHYFAFCLIAEIVPDEAVKQRAIRLIEEMTDHIIENDLYFIDQDGKPTRWGRWNPEYVNGFPTTVGDRKLNSSNITGFLQAAYHFTGKQKYKDKAYELFEKHGYLDNLMRPMAKIGVAEDDDLSKLLSESWNHSDDEMYFLSYWYLHPYAFTDDLKTQYQETIRDHWQAERPEKDGLWNFCYAMTGAKDFDLEESIWFLQEYPLDLVEWSVHNSHRKDIELLPPNFRGQTTRTVLPPDEVPVHKHNTNTFLLDRNRGGLVELSGDLFLLPYWMGRYLGVISEGKQ